MHIPILFLLTILVVIFGVWYVKLQHLTPIAHALSNKDTDSSNTPNTVATQNIETMLNAELSKNTDTNLPKNSTPVPAAQPVIATVPVTAPIPITTAAPSFSGTLYVDSTSTSATASKAWMATHGANAGLERINATPSAHWFGNWNADIRNDVSAYVSAAATVNQIPVLVAYNIPGRDCGGQSAGGATNAAAYDAWITQFAAGIGNRPAIVILEPDAVASDCFNSDRAAMLNKAISTLSTTKASTYIDGGNATWRTPTDMANRLHTINITQTAGFSLNVSNFITTNTTVAYGTSLSALIGGKHFVIDTSRNGNGPTPDSQWCNPDGRALGQLPTLQTGITFADAYLWIKTPGESDGSCGPQQAGTSPAPTGMWWPQYALMLARNIGW